MDYEALVQLAKEAGFTAWGPLNVDTLVVKQEVRDMCATNTCGRYEKCWSCPPGCGTLEDCSEQLKRYPGGILVQTSGDIEDSFDFEAIVEIQQEHHEHMEQMYAQLRKAGVDVLALGAGSCMQCKECTYPDASCRFPDKMISSMEAYGLVVLEVCKANNLQYYYGSEKMAYTSCFLVR